MSSKTKLYLSGFMLLLLIVLPNLLFRKSEERMYVPRNISQNHSYHAEGMYDLLSDLRRNVVTGEVERKDFVSARKAIQKAKFRKAPNLNWTELGPDNVGGRTRAILIDRDNSSKLYAGSVSGGLFMSQDEGNSWSRINGFSENLSIASISQTSSGRLYVSTGHERENTGGTGSSGARGYGLYVSDDGIDFQHISGTEDYTNINEIVAHPIDEKVFLACSGCDYGFKKFENGLITNMEDVASGLPATGTTESLAISKDGQVIILGFKRAGVETYVSTNGGSSFEKVEGKAANGSKADGGIPRSGSGRIEYAISDVKNRTGNYSVYAVSVGGGGSLRGKLLGVYLSEENGEANTWYEIAPRFNELFKPFTTGFGNGQGLYDNIISVVPGKPGTVLVGGIDIYKWEQAVFDPPFGQWDRISSWFASPGSDLYIHADNHEMKWGPNGTLFIGNDGGIGISKDEGKSFYPANRGYNVTQFYSIAYSREGHVMAGAQDNGTQLNDFENETGLQFREVRGGDGFACDISQMHSDYMFASIYYGGIQRSDDRGETWSDFLTEKVYGNKVPGNNLGSFHTVGRLYENKNDVLSKDTIRYIPKQMKYPGDLAVMNGLTFNKDYSQIINDTMWFVKESNYDVKRLDSCAYLTNKTQVNLSQIEYELISEDSVNDVTNNRILKVSSIREKIVYYIKHPSFENNDLYEINGDSIARDFTFDTLKVQDVVQSLYAFGLGEGSGGVWVTRDALRFSRTPTWHNVLTKALLGEVFATEFSKDGDHLFVATRGGELWRVSGLRSLYSENDLANITNAKVFQASGGATITGIDVDPNNSEHVVVTIGGYGNTDHVFESNSAVTSSTIGSFASIQNNLPDFPVYDVVIDKTDGNYLIIGTDQGVFSSENGGLDWNFASEDIGPVPVFAVRQQWLGWQDSQNTGEIYIGTHGRGIWKSASRLSVNELKNNSSSRKDLLTIYPNPTTAAVTIEVPFVGNEALEVEVIDISGRIILSKQLAFQGINSTVVLSTSELNSGTYVVRIRQGVFVRKGIFIKN